MKLEYPTIILEYILSGIFTLSPFLFFLYLKIPIPELGLPQNVFLILLLLSVSYLAGIGSNGAAMNLTRFILRNARNKIVTDFKESLNTQIKCLKEIGCKCNNSGAEISDTKDDNYNLIECLAIHVNDSAKHIDEEVQYLRRLNRMARSGLIGLSLWLLTLIILLFLGIKGESNLPQSIYFLKDETTLIWIPIIFILLIGAGLIVGYCNQSKSQARRIVICFLSLNFSKEIQNVKSYYVEEDADVATLVNKIQEKITNKKHKPIGGIISSTSKFYQVMVEYSNA
ncbi:MAG: hypothetical protein KDC73_03695 [Ignavibacteriae bacterium]|nr:hypothetical protein [Ignavibacteriota bacterium]MCB9244176.1 hypothetical protein [Ignavibacteriales bacterium]